MDGTEALGQEDVAQEEQAVALAGLFGDVEEDGGGMVAGEEGKAAVAAELEEVVVTHGMTFGTAPYPEMGACNTHRDEAAGTQSVMAGRTALSRTNVRRGGECGPRKVGGAHFVPGGSSRTRRKLSFP